MLRKCSLLIAILLLIPALAFAAPAKKKKHVTRQWHGYGFLPGYVPADISSGAVKRWRRGPYDGQRPYNYQGPYQEYVRWGYYWYPNRTVWGFGGPGFYQGRYNGGSFGPCYTRTPIGPVWNCGM